MNKTIPKIENYMTVIPQTIGIDQSIEKAEEMMQRLRIRHLPVLSGGKLVGVVSDRDLKLYRGLVTSKEAAAARLEDVYQPETFSVSPSSPLDEVVSSMAERKLGSAVVMDNGKLVGIFTAVDALSAFSELLHSKLKN